MVRNSYVVGIGFPMKNNKGFTLIEVTITVAIIGILFTMGPQLLITINKFFFLNRARIETQRDTRAVLELINRELRQAQKDSITIDQATSQPPFSRITFLKVNGTTSMIFYQNNKDLIMSVGGTNHTIASNLRYVSFAFPKSSDLSIVSVSVVLEKATYQGLTSALHMAIQKVRVMN
jgi:prepilin-type N-terminal cleavage/methylation domain-containing protein